MEKRALRKQLLDRRKQLDAAVCQDLSQLIQQRLVASECFSLARTLVLYSPVNNEVHTDLLLQVAQSLGKRICYPRVCGQQLQLVTIASLADLTPGAFGVAEPSAGSVVSGAEVDLIVVPGVAFDLAGFRLGYGKGFYDRELSRMTRQTFSAGLCFDFQLCDRLPIEDHDQQLDYVVTEKRLIPCHKDVAGSP